MIRGLGGRKQEDGTLFGPGGLFGSKPKQSDEQGTGVAVEEFVFESPTQALVQIRFTGNDSDIRIDAHDPAEQRHKAGRDVQLRAVLASLVFGIQTPVV